MSETTFGEPSPEGRNGVSVKLQVCPECGRKPKRVTAGKCHACYEYGRRRGIRKWAPLEPWIQAALHPMPGTSDTFARRVFSHIDASGDCWEWDAATTMGYGVINRGGKGAGTMSAHLAVWNLLVGPIPEGMEYDHLCRNHRCVNPDHAEIVTPAENKRRGYSPPALLARQKTCSKGHPFDGRRKRGERYCKRCDREGQRTRYARRAQRSAA